MHVEGSVCLLGSSFCLADDFADGVDYGFGGVDLNVVAAAFDDHSRAVRGEARRLLLHLACLYTAPLPLMSKQRQGSRREKSICFSCRPSRRCKET